MKEREIRKLAVKVQIKFYGFQNIRKRRRKGGLGMFETSFLDFSMEEKEEVMILFNPTYSLEGDEYFKLPIHISHI